MKKLFLLIPFFLFAFTSKYLPNYNINIQCDKILHKKAFDIYYSYKWKTPKLVVYKVNGNLIDKYNYSRKHLRFRPDGKIISFLAPNLNTVGKNKAKKYLSNVR